MGESASARTERELAALRGDIDRDLATLRTRLSEDVDPRRLARRQPVAVVGTLGSLAAVVGVALASRIRSARRARGENELDQIVQRLGGRLDQLKGRTRKRFREALRKEIAEVESGPRAKQMFWESATAALTSAAALLAQRFASRLTADDELPEGRR
jgi:type VI protein secretion system component VasF